jgi:hypothetical protein
MLASPFAFFRGAALVMAADLAATPSCGRPVQLCGDAHLSNFGLFGTPERRLAFGSTTSTRPTRAGGVGRQAARRQRRDRRARARLLGGAAPQGRARHRLRLPDRDA